MVGAVTTKRPAHDKGVSMTSPHDLVFQGKSETDDWIPAYQEAVPATFSLVRLEA